MPWIDADPYYSELMSLGYTPDQAGRIVERAAIMEYDGKKMKASAEWLARKIEGPAPRMVRK